MYLCSHNNNHNSVLQNLASIIRITEENGIVKRIQYIDMTNFPNPIDKQR